MNHEIHEPHENKSIIIQRNTFVYLVYFVVKHVSAEQVKGGFFRSQNKENVHRIISDRIIAGLLLWRHEVRVPASDQGFFDESFCP